MDEEGAAKELDDGEAARETVSPAAVTKVMSLTRRAAEKGRLIGSTLTGEAQDFLLRAPEVARATPWAP